MLQDKKKLHAEPEFMMDHAGGSIRGQTDQFT